MSHVHYGKRNIKEAPVFRGAQRNLKLCAIITNAHGAVIAPYNGRADSFRLCSAAYYGCLDDRAVAYLKDYTRRCYGLRLYDCVISNNPGDYVGADGVELVFVKCRALPTLNGLWVKLRKQQMSWVDWRLMRKLRNEVKDLAASEALKSFPFV